MPSLSEIEELVNNTTLTWTTYNGVDGYLVKSLTNGNSIFFSASGVRFRENLAEIGELGIFWSSTPHYEDPFRAYLLLMESDNCDASKNDHYYGLPIRPVSE